MKEVEPLTAKYTYVRGSVLCAEASSCRCLGGFGCTRLAELNPTQTRFCVDIRTVANFYAG